MSSTAVAKREPEGGQLEAIERLKLQETPVDEIRWKPGRGGRSFPYTDTAYVIRTLNETFAWNWDFVADNEQLIEVNGKPFEVKVRGTLTVRLGGQSVTKTQFGSQQIELIKNTDTPVSIGDCYKGAASDAMKKCASLLGIALDLYDSDSAVHTGKKPNPPQAQQQRPQQAQPVKQVKLEGQQPTSERADELPTNLKGQAGQIMALARALKFAEPELASLIQNTFGTIIMPGKLAAAVEFMTGEEHRELIRVLKQRLGGK